MPLQIMVKNFIHRLVILNKFEKIQFEYFLINIEILNIGTMQEKYENAKSILVDKFGNPTQHYKAYLQYQTEYQNIVKAKDSAYANAFNNPIQLQRWPIEGKSFQLDIDNAMNKWVALGYKNEIENAISIMANQGTGNS